MFSFLENSLFESNAANESSKTLNSATIPETSNPAQGVVYGAAPKPTPEQPREPIQCEDVNALNVLNNVLKSQNQIDRKMQNLESRLAAMLEHIVQQKQINSDSPPGVSGRSLLAGACLFVVAIVFFYMLKYPKSKSFSEYYMTPGQTTVPFPISMSRPGYTMPPSVVPQTFMQN